jgi:Zn-dependent protease with chaperone function
MNDLEEARRLLPEWVRLVPWLVPLYLAASGYVVTRLIAFWGLRALPASPWTERARVSFPVRALARMTRLFHVTAGFTIVVFTASSWVAQAPTLRALLMLSGAFFGALAAAVGIDVRVMGEPRKAILRSWLATSLLMFGPIYVMLLFWALSLSSTGTPGHALSIVGFVAVVVLALGYTSSLAVLLGVARPARASVSAAVERAAKGLGVRVRRVLEIDSVFCNAFAFPVARHIAFTARAAETLDDAELEAVAAHELGHLDEPRFIRGFRPLMVALIAFLVLLAPRMFTPNTEFIAIALAATIVALVLARLLARKAEKHADSYANHTGAAYARALEKLSRHNLMPLVTSRPGAHGYTWDRIVARRRSFCGSRSW